MRKGSMQASIWKGLLVIVVVCVLPLIGCRGLPNTPGARHGAKMIYDPAGKQVILFGGRTEGGVIGNLKNDIWSLDMETHRWQELDTTSGPSPRLSPGLIYDLSHHQIILFGGYTNQGRMNDTWLLDLDSYEWEEASPVESPPARSDMGLAYDERHQVVVLFGGYCLDHQRDHCNDTWVFDPESQNWIEQNPETSPPVMYGLTLDYDPENGQFLLWGGHISDFSQGGAASAGYNDSIWAYNYSDNQWLEISPGYQSHPVKRYWHQATYVSAHHGLLIFGGDTGYGYKNDSWFYDPGSQSWERLTTAQVPPARIVGTMIYCPDYEQAILFGGLNNDFTNLQDTWIYSNISGEWEQISH